MSTPTDASARARSRAVWSRPNTGTTTNGMLDIVGTFPRAGGGGTFQFGIRLSPNSNGSFDLITLLTKQ